MIKQHFGVDGITAQLWDYHDHIWEAYDAYTFTFSAVMHEFLKLVHDRQCEALFKLINRSIIDKPFLYRFGKTELFDFTWVFWPLHNGSLWDHIF